jgi:hypothetical protein
MIAFWPDIVRPILEAIEPLSIVEIGAESGKNTRLLLEFARGSDIRVHAVDPAPRFDAEVWKREFGEQLVMHRLPSLVALASIPQFDVVVIDGDHNWYTVFNELRLIEELSGQIGQPMPLIFLHDIAWPYGRRDLYYDPSSIPEAYRQPWARMGISPTSSALVPTGGINAKLCNARHEGGPKNGVLTAVEDYLKSTPASWTFVQVPAVYGLGILLPAPLAEAKPEVARRIAVWAVPEVHRFIERLEMARIAMLTGVGG